MAERDRRHNREEKKEEEIRCLTCGKTREEALKVGKTQSVERGVRTVYEALKCDCGNYFRGKVLEKVELKRRDFKPRPRR